MYLYECEYCGEWFSEDEMDEVAPTCCIHCAQVLDQKEVSQ